MIFLAIAVPEIVLASALLSMFVETKIPLGCIDHASHIGFSIAFVAITVRARVQGMDTSLESAAQDLYATPVQVFFKVTLPLILPGIVAGFLLAFVLSLDDFVITNFVGGRRTLPDMGVRPTSIGVPPPGERLGHGPVRGRPDPGRSNLVASFRAARKAEASSVAAAGAVRGSGT